MGPPPSQGDENRLPSDDHSPWKHHAPLGYLSIPITDPKWKRRLPFHPEEPTCLRQVKGAMNSTDHRGLDGCPMFALANVGRKSRAKPLQRFWSVQGTVVH
jgi:hypothetical protein